MSKKIVISIISMTIIGILLVGGAILLKGEGTVVKSAPELNSKEDVLVVYGEGSISLKPDLAYINIGVETLDMDAKKSQDMNRDTMNKVLSKLKSMKIDEKDIMTISYRVDQDIDYSNGKRKVLGFRVQNIVRVTVRDIDRVGEILNAAYNEGANNIDGISFDVEDRSEAYKKALEKAIEDAKGKAEVMAKQAGVSIGKPAGIYEGMQQDIIYGESMSVKRAYDMDASVPMETGELNIRANVTVKYKY